MMNFICSVGKLSTRQHEFYDVTINYLIGRDLTIKEPSRYPHQKRKNLLYRHSCRPCRVSDAREQESAVSLNVNRFLSVVDFRFMTSQIPCHASPNTQAARNDVSMCRFWMDLEQDVGSRHNRRLPMVYCWQLTLSTGPKKIGHSLKLALIVERLILAGWAIFQNVTGNANLAMSSLSMILRF